MNKEVVNQAMEIALDAIFSENEISPTTSVSDIAAYASSRAAHLATLVGQPGFQEAVAAERDNVALRAGIVASQQAEAVEQRVLGLLQGALTVAASALAA